MAERLPGGRGVSDRFPNLVGSAASDAECTAELTAVGIEAVYLPESCRPKHEVQTIVMGQLGQWGFRRAWYYWVAEGPGIPHDEAEQLHAAHGTTVRVDGHACAPSPREWFKGRFAVGMYHVDSRPGLRALADLVRLLMEPSDERSNDDPAGRSRDGQQYDLGAK